MSNFFKSASDILQQISLEVGLGTQVSPFSSTDAAVQQLVALLNPCGRELLGEHQWEHFEREWSFTTVQDQEKYDLPTDFCYLIDQTGWDRSNNVPIAGPLSAQEWTYLAGRNLVSSTIYATFRKTQGQFWFYPVQMPGNQTLSFEYLSEDWVVDASGNSKNSVTTGADVIQYDSYMYERLLRLRWKETKGFDTTKDQQMYNKALSRWTSRDTPAPILNAAGRRRFNYLTPYGNTPDTGYGDV